MQGHKPFRRRPPSHIVEIGFDTSFERLTFFHNTTGDLEKFGQKWAPLSSHNKEETWGLHPCNIKQHWRQDWKIP